MATDRDKDNSGSRPVPDPTLLTTQQLLREVAQLRTEFAEQIGSVQTILETRLNGMDKAIELLQATADRFPARMDEKIHAAIGVHDEKFDSIAKQFTERDVRSDSQKRDGKDALDAALAAQKEAAEKQATTFGLSVAKSEAATDKRIDQMSQLIQTNSQGLDGKITDLKERLTRIEGKGEGAGGAMYYVLAALGALVGVSGFIFAVARH
jgi:chromosome segregation ATPase